MKGDRFKELYKERGYNQTNFAKEIGMNRSFLSQVESEAEKLQKKYVKESRIVSQNTFQRKKN